MAILRQQSAALFPMTSRALSQLTGPSSLYERVAYSVIRALFRFHFYDFGPNLCVGFQSATPTNGESDGNCPPEYARPLIMIADDHAIFLEALKCFLEKSYVVIGTVTDGRSLITEAT